MGALKNCCFLLIFAIQVFSDDLVTVKYTDYNYTDSGKCTLIQDDPNKPNPSLVQCYRNNPKACCNSATDDYIKNQYSSFLSASCYRKFPELEAYFCYGCSPTEFKSTDRDNKTITICSSLAQRIWGDDLTQKTTKFDQCGMNSFWLGSDSGTFLPSYAWGNITDFLNDVKPPHFDGYLIQIADTSNCYSSAGSLIFRMGVIFGLMTLFYY